MSSSDEDNMLTCESCCGAISNDDSTVCEDCYDSNKQERKRLKRENKHLKSKLAFLCQLSLDSTDFCFSDIVLLASGPTESLGDANPQPIQAHRAVLGSRSPVLRAMLENQMEESLTGIIKISDVSHDTLKVFVNYLYTAKASLDEDLARDLLILAEKYQVAHLKMYCEKYLISQIDKENCLSYYVFARNHSAENLLDVAVVVIMSNMGKVTKREEYAQLVEKDPRLVIEMYEAAHRVKRA